MKILLDTCILSELRKPESQILLKKALQPFESEELFISVISIGDITKGIALLPASKKKTDLTHWAMQLEKSYTNRILNINNDIAHIWGELTANAQKQGRKVPAADGLIAATALTHGLCIMTRNISDFEFTSTLLINPWS